AGWITGAPLGQSIWAAFAFLLGAALRATLEHRAGAHLFDAADRVIAAQRSALMARALSAPGVETSAETAARIVQKLPVLLPWITRYHTALARALWLPVLLIALSATQSWAVALVYVVAVPVIPLFMALLGMAAEQASRRQLDEIGTINSMVMERISAMLDIRLLGAAERATAAFQTRAEDLRERTMAVLRIAFLSSTVLELFAALGVAMVAVYVGFSLLGELSFGTWGAPLTVWQGVFLLVLAPEVFQPLRDLAAAWHDRAAAQALATELRDANASMHSPYLGDGAPARPLPGELGLHLVDAVADLTDRALPLPDLSVKAGDAVAVAGPSGAGKSTLLSVLAGLTPLRQGQLHVCATPLSAQTADAWRARLAFLPQRIQFPDAPLAEILDPLKTGRDLAPALALARATAIVEHLPDGLATRLGETGGGVSGGEARRLLLARAVMMERDLLLADEPTADLDADTARVIIDTLLSLRASGMSLIVATHDPVLIAAMDRVVEVGE
ncbi:MAG: ATP-binding cassette domain-containing protein, partial [Pseudomonadota bacterium]